MRTVVCLTLVFVATGCGGGGHSSTTPALLHVSSSAFINNSRLAEQYTCDGAGNEPEVQVGVQPVGTKELVLVVSDPDAPSGTFTHLTRYGIGPSGSGKVDTGTEGKNSAGSSGWTPPCPPNGSGTHHYVWTVYALRDASNLKPGASPPEVNAAVKDPLARGSLTALYSR